MKAMTKHRSHSAAFKRQVAQEFVAGETLHGLSKRHDISRQLIRIWVGKYEAGALDDDVQAADLPQLPFTGRPGSGRVTANSLFTVKVGRRVAESLCVEFL